MSCAGTWPELGMVHRAVVMPALGALDGLEDRRLGLVAAGPVGALDGLAGLEVLVGLEEVLDLETVELADVLEVLDVLLARVAAGMHRILSSPPASSRMWNMPIGRARTRQPGQVGSSRSTSASSGSPSSPRLSSMYP